MKKIYLAILFPMFIKAQAQAQKKDSLNKFNAQFEFAAYPSEGLGFKSSFFYKKKNILHIERSIISSIGAEKYFSIKKHSFHSAFYHRWEHNVQNFLFKYKTPSFGKKVLGISSNTFRGGRINAPEKDKYVQLFDLSMDYYFKNWKIQPSVSYEISELKPWYFGLKTRIQLKHSILNSGLMISTLRAKSLYSYIEYPYIILGFAREWNLDQGEINRLKFWVSYKIKNTEKKP